MARKYLRRSAEIRIKRSQSGGAVLAGNFAGAAQEFLDIDHALVNGKPTELPGLKARRQAEAAMFLGGQS